MSMVHNRRRTDRPRPPEPPELEFRVDLRPEEYGKAMRWYQFNSTLTRRINHFIGWAILILTPVTVWLFALVAPEALSVWFWLVALVAVAYAAYSTLIIRRQISQQAADLLVTRPALADTSFRITPHALRLQSGEQESQLTWSEFHRLQELSDLFLLFYSEDDLLIIPKRCLPHPDAFRTVVAARLPQP